MEPMPYKEAYAQILREEIMPATGCTEPISIAYCAAKAHEVLGMQPTAVTVSVSGNILKNVSTIYNSWRLEAPRRPSHRPGPLTGTQLPTATWGSVQEQTYHGDSRKDLLPTPPGGQLSEWGREGTAPCPFCVPNRRGRPPELNSAAWFQW